MKKFLYSIIVILIILILTLIYGRFIGVNGLNTNEYVIHSDSIDTSYRGIKILHFSDMHYKKVITEKRVNKLVEEIIEINPDIVIYTGDLLDKDYTLTNDDINFLIDKLSKIPAKYGKFAIIGDNDKDEYDTLKNIYKESNFTLLDNSYQIIKNENNKSILIGGLNCNKIDTSFLEKIENNNISYKIILTHKPDYFNELNKVYSPDLFLAGHSLNGSINIPLIKQMFLESGAKKYYNSHYKIDNTDLYITNGIGVSNINFRIFNTPSINLYRILK